MSEPVTDPHGSDPHGSDLGDTGRAPSHRAADARAVGRRAHAAIARSAAAERTLAVLVGVILFLGGALVALVSVGVFGTARAGRPMLDPILLDALRAQPLTARIVVIVLGIALIVLGLVWAARALRPERRPDLVLATGPDLSVVVTATAAAEAVAAQAGGLPGVRRARARLVGTETAPAVRVTLWLADTADVRTVLAELDDAVLETARQSLDLDTLPAAVRLELDATTGPRVA